MDPEEIDNAGSTGEDDESGDKGDSLTIDLESGEVNNDS